MPSRSRLAPQLIVTPRFEIFYALYALEGAGRDELRQWRSETERRLPARLRTSIARIAPSPLLWPLIADALRDAPADISFDAMLALLREMDASAFRDSVLAGVFKTPGAVEKLVSGHASLRETVGAEASVPAQLRLIAALGLHPFSKTAPAPRALQALVDDVTAYRDEVVEVLDSFWRSAFGDTWMQIEPALRQSCRSMRRAATGMDFSRFASEFHLPVRGDGGDVVTVNGSFRIPATRVNAVYVLPSAFNTAGLWTSYTDYSGRMRFFLPIRDPEISPTLASAVEPELVFKALGDTTRYAIATTLARQSMTSVQLARVFRVSKPTISHHVAILRSAGLLEETRRADGSALSLNRRALEKASAAAVREMFSLESTKGSVKRSRRRNAKGET